MTNTSKQHEGDTTDGTKKANQKMNVIVNTQLGLCRLLSMSQPKENALRFLTKVDCLTIQDWRYASCLLGSKDKENKTKVASIVSEILESLYMDVSSQFTIEFKHLHLLPPLSPSAIDIYLNYGSNESYSAAILGSIKDNSAFNEPESLEKSPSRSNLTQTKTTKPDARHDSRNTYASIAKKAQNGRDENPSARTVEDNDINRQKKVIGLL